MSKKAFHPGSYANQKRIHEAEAKAEAKRKHDEETLAQYQKEQELFNQKSLVSKQSKEKLSLNFMYEAPPGVDKPNAKKNDKVEWTSSSGRVEAIDFSSANTSKSSEPTISLEWKREKPVQKSSLEVKQSDKSRSHASDIKKIEVKEESRVDLKWKREISISNPNSTEPFHERDHERRSSSGGSSSSHNNRDKNIKSETESYIKRIKKER